MSTKIAFSFFPHKTGFVINVFAVFVDSIGGGPLINVFMRANFDVFQQNLRFHFSPSKQSSLSQFLEFLGTV